MRRVALTGGIATGKSHVRALFERFGVPTIDADVIARDVVASGTPGLDAIAVRFGPQILDAQGALARKKLASIVFADPAAVTIWSGLFIRPSGARSTRGSSRSTGPFRSRSPTSRSCTKPVATGTSIS